MIIENEFIDYNDPSVKYEFVLYLRVSDKSQVTKGSGLSSQEIRGREYAKSRGTPVVKVFYDDGVSGKILERPDVMRMLNFLKKKKPGVQYVVLIDEISRLARDVRVHFDLRDALDEVGALLDSPTTQFKITRDADGTLNEGMQAMFAQHFRMKNAETSRNRKWARLKGGYWPYTAPVGFKFKMTKTHGNMLVRNEPIASIIQEAFEGYASGRFASQAEVKRFLESQPAFPYRSCDGTIRHQRITEMFKRPVYAGYVHCKILGVPLQEGKHKPLVSWATYEKVQNRMKTKKLAPARKDINLDFPLRGFVTCSDCGKPLRAGWSKSRSGKRHPYYNCQTKGCISYGKSIRRADIEGEFIKLLRKLRPTQPLFELIKAMVLDAAKQRTEQIKTIKHALKKQITTIEKKINSLLDYMAEASSPLTAKAYDQKIEKLQIEKISAQEKLQNLGLKTPNTDLLIEPCMKFLSNPCKIWEFGDIHLQKMVLRLVFSEPLAYAQNEGYRTAKTSLPFNMLDDKFGSNCKMVRAAGLEPARS